MRSASEAVRRVLRAKPAGFRPIALIALLAPLAFTGCVSNQAGMKTARLASRAPAAPAGPDAYGYAPVKIAAFADGSHVALPSQKPDAARPAAATAAAPAAAAVPAAAVEPKDPAARRDPDAGNDSVQIAALAADVADRKAVIGPLAPASVPVPALETVPVPTSADVSAGSKSGRVASSLQAAATALNPVNSVPATIAAVAESADAVKVAAIATTGKAVDAVSERLGDTFGGRDTITGDAAIDRLIETSAAENGIPSELAYAVVRVESHYNPTAIGGGAYGLSQIKPATARGLGFSGPNSALYDPATNLRYGMKYLAGAWQKSGHDVCGTAMKYKGGHRTTRMSRAAAVYCANVKRHMAAIERRRGPMNAGTLLAANQRIEQIALASGAPRPLARGGVLVAGGKPAPESFASPARMAGIGGRTIVYDSAAPVVAASASTGTGGNTAAALVPAVSRSPQKKDEAFVLLNQKAGGRGGRVVGDAPRSPGDSAFGLTN